MLNGTAGALSGRGWARKFACCCLIVCTCALTCCTFCGSAFTVPPPVAATFAPAVCWPVAPVAPVAAIDGAALADAATDGAALADAAIDGAADAAGVMLGATDAFAFAAPVFVAFSPRPYFPVGATVAFASVEAFVPVAPVAVDVSAFARPLPRPLPVPVSVVVAPV